MVFLALVATAATDKVADSILDSGMDIDGYVDDVYKKKNLLTNKTIAELLKG